MWSSSKSIVFVLELQEMVSMNKMAEILLSFENKRLPIDHFPGPEVVCGCNSDNTLINKELRWAPSMHLKVWVHILGSEASYTLFAVVSLTLEDSRFNRKYSFCVKNVVPSMTKVCKMCMYCRSFVRWCWCSRMDYASHIYRSRSRLRKRSHKV